MKVKAIKTIPEQEYVANEKAKNEKDQANNADENELFTLAMRGVRRLKQIALAPPLPPVKVSVHPKKRVNYHHREEHSLEHWWQHASSQHQAVDSVDSSGILFYAHPSVSAKKQQQLRTGRFSTRCILDLHGMTEQEARDLLAHWLASCHRPNDQFALIIHGKGMGGDQQEPVLKNFINWWLRHQSRVLAFCSAREDDGGVGAVYVLFGDVSFY
jgi:DNA-nicking Smr family endonuclease